MITSQLSRPQFAYSQASVRAFEALQLRRTADGALMGQAAKIIARLAGQCMQNLPQTSRILVLAGPGHNGKDALLAMQILIRSGWDCMALEGFDSSVLAQLNDHLPNQGLVIDGWLGLGQSRALSNDLSAAVNQINQWRVKKKYRYCISIDIPTGLHPDLGHAWPTAIKADLCLCLLRPLRGLFSGQARGYWEQLVYAPLVNESVVTESLVNESLVDESLLDESLLDVSDRDIPAVNKSRVDDSLDLSCAEHSLDLLPVEHALDLRMLNPGAGSEAKLPNKPVNGLRSLKWGEGLPHRIINGLSFFSDYRLAHRPAHAHKGLMGDVLLVGGARGMDGALRLAAQGCLAIGPGKCYVLAINRASSLLGFPSQVMQLKGRELKAFSSNRARGVIAIGCGLGQSSIAQEYLRGALDSSMDLVLDADALNLLASDPSLLNALRELAIIQTEDIASAEGLSNEHNAYASLRPKPARSVVLTPHPLEAARLLGISRDEVERDRFEAVNRLVDLTACTVILKGAGSLVQSPGYQSVIIDRSAPALAQAGSGDVLCGVVAALLARHPTIHAQVLAAAAAFLHADAAARWTESNGRYVAMPFDALAESISSCFGQMV